MAPCPSKIRLQAEYVKSLERLLALARARAPRHDVEAVRTAYVRIRSALADHSAQHGC